MTQAWMRNPVTYIRECAEAMMTNIAWSFALLRKNNIDPKKHIEAHIPAAAPYRLLVVGVNCTREIRRDSTIEVPTAVYPTWQYGVDPIDQLEKFLADPTTSQFRSGEMPVPGQEHRVVVIGLPSANTLVGRGALRMIAEMQRDYPEAILHVHGMYSYSNAFGKGLASADVLPRDWAAQGYVVLPNGRRVKWEEASEWEPWLNLIGFTPRDMSIPRNRCIFNIKSALWAAANWNSDVKFAYRRGKQADPDSPVPVPVEVAHVQLRRVPFAINDKIVCDQCSVSRSCRYYRHGGVCSIPESEGSQLSRYFQTRDSDTIIEGLGKLMSELVDAVVTARDLENSGEELQPELTKRLNSAIANGIKLAKLVNPDLAKAGSTQVNVNVGSGGQAAIMTSPQEMIATAVRELQMQGFHRDDITMEMIAQQMVRKVGPERAIEANVLD